VKPWPEAGSLNGSWTANTNHGRALTCVQFLLAHGFLTETQASTLSEQADERSAASS
jgi:hypothetical protein